MKWSLEERRNIEVGPRCGNVVNDVIEGDGDRFGGRRHLGNGMEFEFREQWLYLHVTLFNWKSDKI
jgi:hypothetical protein